jgi:2-isopropylmalate synthase
MQALEHWERRGLNRVLIFDTTLRDGEQSPGASMTVGQKVALAHQLACLDVDVIEAGFPYSSPEDFESVSRIAQEVKGPTICGLARTKPEDIEACANAVRHAKCHRVHTFVGTSPSHLNKLSKTADEVLEMAVEMVGYACTLVEDVEFSAEDAMRTDLPYLRDIVEATIEAGAKTVNIPDTVGYTTPWIMDKVIRYLFNSVPNINRAVISVHCHDDLGLSVANSLAAIRAGARQVECTVNGIGERAGNASLEEIVMALRTRSDQFNVHTDIKTEEILRTSRMVSNFTGFLVQPNKAIVGQNAFRHEAGIHQHGVIMDHATYEIMKPEDVGWGGTELTLGPRSGKHGLRKRLEDLGYDIADDQLNEIYKRFIEMAEKKKQIHDADLHAIMRQVSIASATGVWHLDVLKVKIDTECAPEASVVVSCNGDTRKASGTGNGPIDAVIDAITNAIGLSGTEVVQYGLSNLTCGQDAMGQATVSIESKGKMFFGQASDVNIVKASAHAFLDAVNRLLFPAETS